jgi:hypothetical protein
VEIECNRCKTRASMPLDAIHRPRDAPIWKAGRIVPLPVLRNASLQAARAHDQADRNTPDHAFHVGASDEER